MTVISKKIEEDLIRQFNLNFNNGSSKKDFQVCIPKLERQLLIGFLKGYFEGDGCVTYSGTSFRVTITSNSEILLKQIREFDKKGCISVNKIAWCGENAIKFLDLIYSDSRQHLERKYLIYRNELKERFKFHSFENINISFPYEITGNAQVGFDLSILEYYYEFENPNIKIFNTQFRVELSPNYYAEIIPNVEKLNEIGYEMIGDKIFGTHYCGNILITLRKIDNNKPNITKAVMNIAKLFPRLIKEPIEFPRLYL